jgi:hypothetical protein
MTWGRKRTRRKRKQGKKESKKEKKKKRWICIYAIISLESKLK